MHRSSLQLDSVRPEGGTRGDQILADAVDRFNLSTVHIRMLRSADLDCKYAVQYFRSFTHRNESARDFINKLKRGETTGKREEKRNLTGFIHFKRCLLHVQIYEHAYNQANLDRTQQGPKFWFRTAV